jgi:hypothetical protein
VRNGAFFFLLLDSFGLDKEEDDDDECSYL